MVRLTPPRSARRSSSPTSAPPPRSSSFLLVAPRCRLVVPPRPQRSSRLAPRRSSSSPPAPPSSFLLGRRGSKVSSSFPPPSSLLTPVAPLRSVRRLRVASTPRRRALVLLLVVPPRRSPTRLLIVRPLGRLGGAPIGPLRGIDYFCGASSLGAPRRSSSSPRRSHWWLRFPSRRLVVPPRPRSSSSRPQASAQARWRTLKSGTFLAVPKFFRQQSRLPARTFSISTHRLDRVQARFWRFRWGQNPIDWCFSDWFALPDFDVPMEYKILRKKVKVLRTRSVVAVGLWWCCLF